MIPVEQKLAKLDRCIADLELRYVMSQREHGSLAARPIREWLAETLQAAKEERSDLLGRQPCLRRASD